MVAQGLNFIFWGSILVALRIDFGVDLLPDPIGYLCIAVGCFKLQEKFPVAWRAGILSVLMIFISIPTFFIDVHRIAGFGWETYSILLMVLHLILVYFIFITLKEIVESYHDFIIERTNRTFIIYITIHLIQLAFYSFSVNLPENTSLTIGTIIAILALIMTIVFLFLIRSVRKASLTTNEA